MAKALDYPASTRKGEGHRKPAWARKRVLTGSSLLAASLLTITGASQATVSQAVPASTPPATPDTQAITVPTTVVPPFTPVAKPQYMMLNGRVVPIPLPTPVVGGAPASSPATTVTVNGMPQSLPAVAGTTTGPLKFAWPVSQHNVSSPYGMRKHPVLGVVKWHTGADFPQACGTPVQASLPGVVVSAQMTVGDGNRLVIKHADGLYTTYNHLSSFSVTPGSTVTQGQVIGQVGLTGFTTGCHLHFEVLKEVKPGSVYYTQPLDWLLQTATGEQGMIGVKSLARGGTTTDGVTDFSGTLASGSYTGNTYGDLLTSGVNSLTNAFTLAPATASPLPSGISSGGSKAAGLPVKKVASKRGGSQSLNTAAGHGGRQHKATSSAPKRKEATNPAPKKRSVHPTLPMPSKHSSTTPSVPPASKHNSAPSRPAVKAPAKPSLPQPVPSKPSKSEPVPTTPVPAPTPAPAKSTPTEAPSGPSTSSGAGEGKPSGTPSAVLPSASPTGA